MRARTSHSRDQQVVAPDTCTVAVAEVTHDIAGPQYEALRQAGVQPLPDVRSFVTLDILDAAYGGNTSLLG
jgi:hypothetical protein